MMELDRVHSQPKEKQKPAGKEKQKPPPKQQAKVKQKPPPKQKPKQKPKPKKTSDFWTEEERELIPKTIPKVVALWKTNPGGITKQLVIDELGLKNKTAGRLLSHLVDSKRAKMIVPPSTPDDPDPKKLFVKR